MNNPLQALSNAGVSIWLDDLSRARLTSGNLAQKIEQDCVTGVTTNPTIFAGALSQGADYADQLRELGKVSVEEAIKQCTARDVRDACDLFEDVYARTSGYDGRVSIEVAPTLAHETQKTIDQAAELAALVGRENVLIKIPATKEGLPAITETIAAGISVNVTLIFSEVRYREVMEAYLAGLDKAAACGKDLSKIHSVASFFISRVDSEVDKRLAAAGADQLRGKAAIANAQVALGAFEEVFGSERFAEVADRGANKQRPLWASTGTKDPAYSDTLYVTELVADGVVNTMPEKTMDAFADHGKIGPTMEGTADRGKDTLARIADAGIDLDDVFRVLEDEGVDKFIVSWHELEHSVEQAQSEVLK